MAAFESILGPAEDRILHSPIPFQLGGNADVVAFNPPGMGYTYVTNELIGEPGQRQNILGTYELMICHRTKDILWGPNIISRLASYTCQATLEAYDTMDMDTAVPKGSGISSFVYLPFAEFMVRKQKAGLLLCLGITKDELAFGQQHDKGKLVDLLKEKSVYPFTDLTRSSVLVT